MADRLLVRKGHPRTYPDALFKALDNAHRSKPAYRCKAEKALRAASARYGSHDLSACIIRPDTPADRAARYVTAAPFGGKGVNTTEGVFL